MRFCAQLQWRPFSACGSGFACYVGGQRFETSSRCHFFCFFLAKTSVCFKTQNNKDFIVFCFMFPLFWVFCFLWFGCFCLLCLLACLLFLLFLRFLYSDFIASLRGKESRRRFDAYSCKALTKLKEERGAGDRVGDRERMNRNIKCNVRVNARAIHEMETCYY